MGKTAAAMGGSGGKLTPKEMMKMTMNMKIQSKMLNRSAIKADKESAREKLKVKSAMEKGNQEGARLYAENAIRQKNQAMAHRRLASRLDAVASKLETCQNSMKVANNLGVLTKKLGPSLNAMNITQISSTMDDFEKVLVEQGLKIKSKPSRSRKTRPSRHSWLHSVGRNHNAADAGRFQEA